ncbi:MAG: MFS transporter [Desulfobacterales bacterium]
MTREEISWILYDVANSAFVLIVVTAVMPIFFKDIAAAGLDPAVSTAHWGFANSLASLVLALLAPVLGSIADYRSFKKRFLLAFCGLGVTATLMLTTVERGDWRLCLAIFVLAKVGYAGANLFYDAFLVDVAPPERMDWVSAMGYAAGYIGSVVPFVWVLLLISRANAATPGEALPEGAARLGFAGVAVWWLAFTIPLMLTLQQKHFLPPSRRPVADSFRRLWQTLGEIRRYRNVFLFLVAYFFYIDGVDTIIVMATAYGRDIGLGVNVLILAILVIQLVAFPFTLLYGRLAKAFPGKTMLYVGIGVYVLIVLLAFFLPEAGSMRAKTILFWVLAVLVATSMGGIQALSRSFFGRLIPAERSAAFFGFYNIFGKFAAITGPFLMGVVSRVTGSSRFGVLSILVLFVIGGIVLKRVKTD